MAQKPDTFFAENLPRLAIHILYVKGITSQNRAVDDNEISLQS